MKNRRKKDGKKRKKKKKLIKNNKNVVVAFNHFLTLNLPKLHNITNNTIEYKKKYYYSGINPVEFRGHNWTFIKFIVTSPLEAYL